jgi:hypothetical protein
MWKILPTLLLAVSSTAHADRDQFLKDHPTPDELLAGQFFAKWPALAKVYNQRDLDPLLFPGGDACDVEQAAITGRFSESSMSPDGKQLAVITAVRLDAKITKKLGMPSSGDIAVVAIVFDGPAHKLTALELSAGGGCDRPDVAMKWSADGKAVQVTSTSGPAYAAILDTRTPEVRVEAKVANPTFSPAMKHLAGTSTETSNAELSVDSTVVWTKAGGSVTNLAWTSDTRLAFCGAKAKEAPTKYQVDLDTDAKPKVTALGPCPEAR